MTGTGREVQDLGHGSVLADRYRLDTPVTALPTPGPVREWLAHDDRDDVPVILWVLRGAPEAHAELLDAARRARAVHLPGLVPVLDVSTNKAAPAWIALGPPPGRSLRRLLQGEPLPAESARRIIGEASLALARSGDRGLHHTRLSPDDLHITDDGEVHVSGVGITGVRQGITADGDDARRADAVGLVRLMHAALTGRWHGPVSLSAGLPQSPRLAGAVVGPGDLVGGVPHDLDTLCRVTLGPGLDGPLSPHDLADQLAPWAPAGRVAPAPAGIDSTGPCRPITAEIARIPGETAPDQARPALLEPPTPEPAPAGRQVVDVTALEPRTVATLVTTQVAPLIRAGVRASARAGSALASAATTVVHAAKTALPTGNPTPSADVGTLDRPAEAPSRAASAPPSPSTAAEPSGPSGPATAAVTVTDVPITEPAGSAATLLEWAHADDDPAESLIPLPGVDPHDVAPADERQSRVVLSLMVTVVVIAAVIGVLAVRSLTHAGLGLFEDDTTVNLPLNGSAGGAQPAAAPVSPASITRAVALDPGGDGHENDDDVGDAVDSSSSTSWRSDRYKSADFGGLKDGLGLALQLSKGDVREVVAKIGGDGGRVELRTAEGPGIDGSKLVASADVTDGTATLVPARPVTGPYLVLWFTRLPKMDGGYRAEVSDVRVR